MDKIKLSNQILTNFNINTKEFLIIKLSLYIFKKLKFKIKSIIFEYFKYIVRYLHEKFDTYKITVLYELTKKIITEKLQWKNCHFYFDKICIKVLKLIKNLLIIKNFFFLEKKIIC